MFRLIFATRYPEVTPDQKKNLIQLGWGWNFDFDTTSFETNPCE